MIPQAWREFLLEGAVAQAGWLPVKRLQRSDKDSRKAPKGGPLALAGHRCTPREGNQHSHSGCALPASANDSAEALPYYSEVP